MEVEEKAEEEEKKEQIGGLRKFRKIGTTGFGKSRGEREIKGDDGKELFEIVLR